MVIFQRRNGREFPDRHVGNGTPFTGKEKARRVDGAKVKRGLWLRRQATVLDTQGGQEPDSGGRGAAEGAGAVTRRRDPRIFNTFIDVPVLHRKGDPEDVVVAELLSTAHDRGVILHLAYSVKDEIAHAHTPADVKVRARDLIFSEQVQLTEGEKDLHRRVRELIRGNAKAGKHDADAFHLVESSKYGAGYFLTNDKRLLRKGGEIGDLLNMEIVTPTEFLEILKMFEQGEAGK